MKILVTGGCGFIGTHLIEFLLTHTGHSVINIDVLSSASLPRWAKAHARLPQYQFVQGDITDTAMLEEVLTTYRPEAVIHLAAHSDLESAIQTPRASFHTNVTGTFNLLEACRRYWQGLSGATKLRFRYLQVSSDAVYGQLSAPALEISPYRPSSPYAATKAAADQLVHGWQQTYGLPCIIVCPSTSYGIHQQADKLLPQLLQHALAGEALTLYGDGEHIRDWLHVSDAVRGIYLVLSLGRSGETYHISANQLLSNRDFVALVCDQLDQQADEFHVPIGISSFRDLITYVDDHRGNDRYRALDSTKLRQLGWRDQIPFDEGIRGTIDAYLHGDDDSTL